MKILGGKYSVIEDHKFDTALRVIKGQWHGRYFLRNRNAGGDLYVRYLIWNDGQWVSNYNYLDNDWNDSNPAALLAIISFLSHSIGGRVLFLKLPTPAPEHLSDLFYLYRQCNVFFIIERLRLQENHDEYLDHINLSHCKTNIREFFFSSKKAGTRDEFDAFNKKRILHSKWNING